MTSKRLFSVAIVLLLVGAVVAPFALFDGMEWMLWLAVGIWGVAAVLFIVYAVRSSRGGGRSTT